MPYIGKAPISGGFHKLDSLTASATDTYALTLGSAAYYPETANQLLVSLNGVIQAPQDSFTVSGSNLVFDSALTASDSIDFVVALGDVLGVGSVSDGAITTAKIGNNAVTDAKLATSLDLSGKTLTMPTGAVLQVKQSILKTAPNTTSATFSDTGLNVSITPSSASSKILVNISVLVSGVTDSYGALKLYRSGSEITDANSTVATGSNSNVFIPFTGRSANDEFKVQPLCGSYLDSPATTSSTTYAVYWAKLYGTKVQMNSPVFVDTANTYINHGVSTITVMEIAG